MADNSFYVLPIRCTFDNDYRIDEPSMRFKRDGVSDCEFQESNNIAQPDRGKYTRVLCIQLQYFGYNRFVRSSSGIYLLDDLHLYSMDFKERVYVAARISDPLLLEIGRSTARAIQFYLPPSVQCIGAHPKSHWCILTKTFFTHGPARFLARATFREIDDRYTFTIVCGMLHNLPDVSGSQYWLAIYSEQDKEADKYYHRDKKSVVPRNGPYSLQFPGSSMLIEVSGKEGIVEQGCVSSGGFLITVTVKDTEVPVPVSSIPLVSSLSVKVRSKLRYLSMK